MRRRNLKNDAKTFSDRLRSAKVGIDDVFQRLRKAAINVIKIAQAKFDQTLYGIDNPCTTGRWLVITFFKLMEYVRQDINTITRRHLDFLLH